MLAPDVMYAGDQFANAFSAINRVDAFAFAGRNTRVGKLSPDPDWLGPVRTRIARLSDVCETWENDRPEIWSRILLPFADYYTTFHGFAEVSKRFGDDRGQWISMLEALSQELKNEHEASKEFEGQFSRRVKDITHVEESLESSLDKGWRALKGEQAAMLALAAEVTSLQDHVNSLQDNLSGSEMRSGQSLVKSSVSITYELVSTAGESVPFMSMVGMVFTLAQSAYDLVVTMPQISSTIDKLVQARLKASEEAQAAAMTKAVIQLINHFDKSTRSLKSAMPAFAKIWGTEKDKVDSAISALKAGAEPSKHLDLITMPVALESWKTLAGYVPVLSQGAAHGKSVEISIDRGISQAKEKEAT